MLQLDDGLVPVFPLPGCVLFPGVVIPLHVYEPRYRTMMDAVVEREGGRRLIALALLRSVDDDAAVTERARFQDVVCVGRVMAYERLEGGRYNLMLLGCARARVIQEDNRRAYRRARLGLIKTRNDLSSPDAEQSIGTIRDLIGELCGHESKSVTVFDHLQEGGAELPTIVDLLTYHLLPADDCPLKQRVLEEPSVAVRTNILVRWLRSRLDAANRHDAHYSRLSADADLN